MFNSGDLLAGDARTDGGSRRSAAATAGRAGPGTGGSWSWAWSWSWSWGKLYGVMCRQTIFYFKSFFM